MPYLTEISHAYSMKVFEEAENDPRLPVVRYGDLSELVEELRAESPDSSAPLTTAEVALGHGVIPNLVIVDDEPELSEILTSRLVDWGHPPEYIHQFALSSEVLHFASSNPIGIAFIDIKLDGGPIQDLVFTSGMEVLKAIKRHSPSAKAVLMSGFGTYEMARRSILDLGASFYLSKPFRLADVVRIVSWVAGRASTGNVRRDLLRNVKNRGEHILIVDDDPVVSESVSLGLRAFGYETTQTRTGVGALEAIGEARFDAILLDPMMPGVNGLDVLRWIQKERKLVDVFILSAVSDDLTARQTTEMGAKGYFLKPCDTSLIIRTLEFHFAKRQR